MNQRVVRIWDDSCKRFVAGGAPASDIEPAGVVHCLPVSQLARIHQRYLI